MGRFVLSRRRALAGLGGVGAAVALPFACSGSAPRERRVLGVPGKPAVLQIVAHEDDDLLFMNPDLTATLDAGIPVTTVYVTAGEAEGAVDGSQSPLAFAADRQAGVRAAYAQMLRAADDWHRRPVTLAHGQQAELATLAAASHLRLLFLNLPDGFDRQIPAAPQEKGQALSGLLTGIRAEVRTVVPDGGPIAVPSAYTKEDLTAALAGLMAEHRPTILRTLDPVVARQNWRGAPDHGADNPDHTATARFADLALRHHLAAVPSARVTTANYVGYGSMGMGPNLSPREADRKREVFAAYTAHDRNTQHFRDLYAGYPTRRQHRWSPNSLTLLAGPEGVTAFAVLNHQAVRWTCADPAGAWQGPEPLGGAGVTQVGAVRHIDDRIRLFALTVDPHTGAADIATTAQDVPDGDFAPWSTLGSPTPLPARPNLPDPAHSPARLRGDALGTPAAVTDPAGRVHLFVRGHDAAIHRRILTNDTWQPWTRLGPHWGTGLRRSEPQIHGDGRYMLDGLHPVVAADGTVELYAQAMIEPEGAPSWSGAVQRLVRWQPHPDGAMTLDPDFPEVECASHPTATLDRAGRVQVTYQVPDSTETGILTRQPNGHWISLLRIASTGASGTPAPATAAPETGALTHIAVTTPGHGLGIIAQHPAGDYHHHTALGGWTQSAPALTTDKTGRFVAAMVTPDGRLNVSVQHHPGTTAAYSPLRIVGS